MPKKIKKRKKNSFWRKFLPFFFIFLIALAAVFLYFNYFSKIDIKVEGSNQQNLSNINLNNLENNLHNLIKNIPSFLVNSKKIENKILASFPEIAEIKFKINLPKEIIFNIQSRKPVALVCFQNQSKCFLIDENGILFKEEKENNFQGIKINYSNSKNYNLGDKFIEKDILEKILFANNYFNSELNIKIDSISLSEDKILEIKTQEGWLALFDLKENVELQLIKLKLTLEKEVSEKDRQNLQYIDLRFKKVYLK